MQSSVHEWSKGKNKIRIEQNSQMSMRDEVHKHLSYTYNILSTEGGQ